MARFYSGKLGELEFQAEPYGIRNFWFMGLRPFRRFPYLQTQPIHFKVILKGLGNRCYVQVRRKGHGEAIDHYQFEKGTKKVTLQIREDFEHHNSELIYMLGSSMVSSGRKQLVRSFPLPDNTFFLLLYGSIPTLFISLIILLLEMRSDSISNFISTFLAAIL